MRIQKLIHTSMVAVVILGMALAGTPSAFGQGTGSGAGKGDIEGTIEGLNQRINFGLKQGALKPAQAQELRQTLEDIRGKAQALRKANGGTLKPTDRAGLVSRLNEQANTIHSYNQAGTRKAVAADATGPAWQAGQDGAQNTRKLKRQMKLQEKRQLHQFDQAIMQVKEQQQQEYEKEMLQKLGSQRPTILKNKQDLDQVRQNSGAN